MSRPLLRRQGLAAAAALAILAAGAAAAQEMKMPDPPAAAAAPVATTQVKIDNFAFTPAAITVKRGSTVTWINQDDIPHLVVADDKAWRSPPLDTADSFSHVFGAPGEYRYFCGLHPKMTGLVKVE